MPTSSIVAVAMLVVTGLLLWAAGRRILRAGFAIVGLIVGGMAGWIIGQLLNLGMGSWATAAVGAIVLACVLAIAFRIAIAGAMAVIFAIVAPLGVITFAEWQAKAAGKSLSDGEVQNPMTDEITKWVDGKTTPEEREQAVIAGKAAAAAVSEQIDRATTALSESLEGKADAEIAELKRFSGEVVDAVRQKWDSTPESLRPTLTISMIAGGVFGLILGGVAPVFSAVIITALGGSMLWLCGLQILGVRLGVPDGPWRPTSGGGWLTMWLITSAVGVVIQWTFRKRAADKASA